MRYALLGLVLCAATAPSRVLPQAPPPTPTATDAVSPKGPCVRGQPQVSCGPSTLTEFGAAARIYSTGTGPLITWELGRMAGRSASRAVGVAAFAHLREGLSVGIRPRLRLWFSPGSSIDIAPGLVVFGSDGAPGFSGTVALNLTDYAAVTMHVVALQSESPGIYLGGRLGSKPGRVSGLVVPVLAMVAFGFACNSGCGGF